MNIDELKIAIDTIWVLVAEFLVFFMQAGFAMVETGSRVRRMRGILS